MYPAVVIEEVLSMAKSMGYIRGYWQGRTNRYVIVHNDGTDFVEPDDVPEFIGVLRRRHDAAA